MCEGARAPGSTCLVLVHGPASDVRRDEDAVIEPLAHVLRFRDAEKHTPGSPTFGTVLRNASVGVLPYPPPLNPALPCPALPRPALLTCSCRAAPSSPTFSSVSSSPPRVFLTRTAATIFKVVLCLACPSWNAIQRFSGSFDRSQTNNSCHRYELVHRVQKRSFRQTHPQTLI